MDRAAVGEIRRAARAAAQEVGLVQRQALGERRHLDEPADPLRRCGREAEPVALRGRLGQRGHVADVDLLVGGHAAGLDLLALDGEHGRRPGALRRLGAGDGGEAGEKDPQGHGLSQHIGPPV